MTLLLRRQKPEGRKQGHDVTENEKDRRNEDGRMVRKRKDERKEGRRDEKINEEWTGS
jgi:hypothetical protein